jgi:methionyl-tRNA formyltransferase
MKIALIGQHAFGKAVLEAFMARGDTVCGVFCAPEASGARPDVLRQAAQERQLPVFQFASLKSAQAAQAMRDLQAELGVMAYVLQFAPQSFVNIPTHGTIQYHPSLLPRYRGPSAINWAIARGDSGTGLSIFRPTDGLDEGPVILQRACAIGPDETLGEIYSRHLFPEGVSALLEAADLVCAGRHLEQPQDHEAASYEGWFHEAEARINWANHVDQVYNLIRACNPAPGAWTVSAGRKIQLFDCRKHLVRRFAQVAGKPGEFTRLGDNAILVNAQGGQIEILRLKPEGGEKMNAAVFAQGLTQPMHFE